MKNLKKKKKRKETQRWKEDRQIQWEGTWVNLWLIHVDVW